MNQELKDLYIQDQYDRELISKKKTDWSVVNANDKRRREQVKSLFDNGQLKTGLDYYHSAMIFQHGTTTEDYEFANKLCSIAIKKGNKKAKWLYAATLDRILTSKKAQYQKFGTQFRKDAPDKPWYLYPVDPTTTDDERRKYNVPSLTEQLKKEKELNSTI